MAGHAQDNYISNQAEKAYLQSVGYDVHGHSEHTCGTAFEYLYWTDRTFRTNYLVKNNLVSCDTAKTDPGKTQDGTCWRALFREPLDLTRLSFANREWLTKKQLLQVKRNNAWSSGVEIKLRSNGYWHVAPGPHKPSVELSKLSKRARLGGLNPPALPASRAETNLPPIPGAKLGREAPSAEWHGWAAIKVSPPKRSQSAAPRTRVRPSDCSFEIQNHVPTVEELVRQGQELGPLLSTPEPTGPQPLPAASSGSVLTFEPGEAKYALAPDTQVGGSSSCWQCIFQYDLGEDTVISLEMIAMSLIGQEEDAAWIQIQVTWTGEILHFENPPGLPTGEPSAELFALQRAYVAEPIPGCVRLLDVLSACSGDVLVGLTTAVVLGTIGDVEPTLDVVAANFFASETQEVEADRWKGMFRFNEMSHGWCASDFLEVSPTFAKALDLEFGAAKGSLEVKTTLWNEICSTWEAPQMDLAKEALAAPGAFPLEQDDVWCVVPERPLGPHKRTFPGDFVLVTHPDHLETLGDKLPDGVETQALTVQSRSFIELGQRILEGRYTALKDIKEMQRELLSALKVTLPIVEQSDLVYLVSGTTFHYFIGSLFPDKQVYEVCPVPRENNGTCPEFYLGHYASFLSDKPSFGFELGRIYNQWLTAPKYLKDLDWEGEFSYREPPKFHSIAPWAAEKWRIESPNVGFKPYDDFVVKTLFHERLKPKVYFSLGSCEKVTAETETIIERLRTYNIEWHVDPRWSWLFEGCDLHHPGFFRHSEHLADFDWVIHHGGSGVTNTCLAVKVPQTILPQIGDQFIWRDALAKHTVPITASEEELRGYLYHTRLPPVTVTAEEMIVSLANPLPAGALEVCKEVNASFVKPFYVGLPCCHDWNEYGYKLLDLVIGQTDHVWITLFDSGLQRTGRPGGLELKWLAKEHTISVPPLPGWRGVNVTATYPHHAHGWLGNAVPRKGIDSSIKVDDAWLLWLASQNKSAKTQATKTRSVRPLSGPCKGCKKVRELTFLHCARCVGDMVVEADRTGKVPDLPPILNWETPLPKKPQMHKTCGLQLSGKSVRSLRRYFQLDTRMLDRAPHLMVGRALLDKIRDWDDVRWIEAYWHYTKSWPPHYRRTTDVTATVAEVAKLHADVEVAGIAHDVVRALANVLSVSSPMSVARRTIGLNILTPIGRGVTRSKWHVIVDGLRHYSELAATFNITAMPKIVENYFPTIPNARVTSYVSYKMGLARPIRDRARSFHWLENVRLSGSPLMVHLFSLKLPALGPNFGVFHAVVEYRGQYYELQQVSGELTRINRSSWQPEGTPSRPLVKTIVLEEDVVGDLPYNLIEREFSGNPYKILGDNCLVFANFLVYQLTGKVIPWRHFGVFGRDISLNLGTEARQWAVSHFWTDTDERRVTIGSMKAFFGWDLFGKPTVKAALPKIRVGPGRLTKDYGLDALRRVDAALEAYDHGGADDTPWSADQILDLALLGYKRFGLTSHLVSQALFKIRMSRIPTRTRRINLLTKLCSTLRKLHSTRLVGDLTDLFEACGKVRMALRPGKKPAWAPLVTIRIPRHWFRQKGRLVEIVHDPENLTVGQKHVVKLDLPQIFHRYKQIFPMVDFQSPGFKWVRPGEYEIGVKVPMRRNLPEMDALTSALVDELQNMHPFEMGVFSLRFGTEKMAEKVTDRYFTGTFEAGQLIPEDEQDELADAIFRNNREKYANAQLINPEEVWRKWKKNYSAGFPFRFNAKGNAKRQALVDACGGKAAFLECVRNYIASPESFPTVSHAFVKDEVLPKSYIEREKIRTIIAQDPLNYYAQMAVCADVSKRLDPTSFSAVGVSPAHGELAALAEQHLAYTHHFAMDVTALDSTAAGDAIETIKKLRYKGFENHPQREAICSMISGCYDNLMSSWIIDINTGRARLKHQGLSTGHATTTASNTEYMEVMMLYAWKNITGRPLDEFYDQVKFSSFSDDNFWSTNLSKEVFSAKLISDFWLSRGVQVRVEGESDDLSKLSFLAKRFSFDPSHLAEVRTYAGRDARVAIVHDVERLLQKFSDYKKKNTLAYRWEKMVALQANCAHHEDIYKKVDTYLDAIQGQLTRKQATRKFLRQHPRKSYADIMKMMYVPGKNNKSGLIVSNIDKTPWHDLELWWDTMRVDMLSFDGTANQYARVLNQFSGLLELGGLSVEDPGLFLQQPGVMPFDKEFTIEHHCYLLNGCPATFEQFQFLLQKTPFSVFCDAAKFWSIREGFDLSEEAANGLRAKVFLLQGIYTLVAWLERMLTTVPVVGTAYKLFCTAKGMSEKLYSRLNALYYAMFGDSSLVLSAMMPKDHYLSLKVIAFKIWCGFTSTDLMDFAGDLDSFKGVADVAAKLAQDLNNLVFDFDISAIVPRADTGEDKNTGVNVNWTALDHSDSVMHCMDYLEENKIPIVTGPTGCGKSTDFILGLYQKFNTVIVSCPRRVMVQQNPIAQKRVYAGSKDSITPGLINFGTSGYLRRALGELPQDTILVLDEFHELDEDTLALYETYRGKVIVVSATPDFTGADQLTPVALTKSRTTGYTVTTQIKDTQGRIQDVWKELTCDIGKGTPCKTLVIVPTLAMVHAISRHAIAQVPQVRICELYRGHDTVDPTADWYIATSIADSSITIPGLAKVIDCGWSSDWVSGNFVKRPSSHNTMDQRKGRTGRTCDGTYIRLIKKFDDKPCDFSTPFLFNNWAVAKRWSPELSRPVDRRHGCVEALPAGYDSLLEDANWSALLYLTLLYENRVDLDRTRAAYQAMRKFPDRPEVEHLIGRHENKVFKDLEAVERDIKEYTIPGQDGNVWTWDGQRTIRCLFLTPIPAHLQDREVSEDIPRAWIRHLRGGGR